MAEFPAELRSASAARRHTAQQCHAWHLDRLSEDAVLVVSELVTNAACHARTRMGLRLELLTGGIRIEVSDSAGWRGGPVQREPHGSGGRGLALVEALAADHGVNQRADDKTVWAELHETA